MIRPASGLDIPGTAECLERAWHVTAHSLWPLDREVLRHQVASMVNDRSSFAWLEVIDSQVKGVLLGELAPILGTRLKAAQPVAWYCENPHGSVALVKKFEAWAKAKGCAAVEMSVSSGGEQAHHADKVLSCLRYAPLGGNHVKRISTDE